MPKLTIYDAKGASVGSVEIEPTDLAPRINKQLLHDAVVMYEANLRQGTFATKSRALVAGSTKKMYRQKGTGNARAGSRRSGIRRGGGHIFAKKPRDFGYRLPHKALQLATRMAVAAKIRDDQVTVIDDLKFSAPKTREMAAILKALKCHEHKSLLVATAAHDVNLYKSVRNIAGVSMSPVADLNALIVLRPQRLLFTKAALEWIKERAAKSGTQNSDEAAEKSSARSDASKPAAAKRTRKKKES
ncbi:MAG TPA: 50S ribosomal protein L4 [Pirellulales bacterium]|jgi:large subunit ribosomal protein L4|nr:50S ribosomal protein L4 [Pirellulales bacterium]